MICKNCGQPAPDNFCAHCGQSTKVRPINFANFMADISEGVFQLNRGFLHTMIGLFNRPGALIQAYLSGRRKPYFKPIAYAFTLSTLYFLLSKLLETDTFMNQFIEGFSSAASGDNDDVISTMRWFANNYAYTSLLLLPVYALASYVSFKNVGYSYLEHVMINAYLIGQQAIFYLSATLMIAFFGHEDMITTVIVVCSVAYVLLVFFQLFPQLTPVGVVLRTLLTYFLSLLTFFLLLLSIFFLFIK